LLCCIFCFMMGWTAGSAILFFFLISDYESLRIVGLVFAVVLFVLGIAIIVSNRCKQTVPPVSTKSEAGSGVFQHEF
uniref:FXYD domain-containing ion transport regulator n=1 Tax=Amphilophus citrinellus TaxID=61819 RepID=A0A3Q0SEU4_AMPCI